jgi:hypothetical protein
LLEIGTNIVAVDSNLEQKTCMRYFHGFLRERFPCVIFVNYRVLEFNFAN